MEEGKKEGLMGDLYSKLAFPDMIFLRCNILAFKTLFSGFAYLRLI